jgi:hypothetical protein
MVNRESSIDKARTMELMVAAICMRGVERAPCGNQGSGPLDSRFTIHDSRRLEAKPRRFARPQTGLQSPIEI